MNPYTVLLLVEFILFTHWVADFVCQSHWMATNKSKSLMALWLHVMAYSYVLFVGLFLAYFMFPGITLNSIGLFVGVNAVLHFCTDFVTSKMTSYLWEHKQIHNFFVIIGLDQFIHAMCLITTLGLLVNL